MLNIILNVNNVEDWRWNVNTEVRLVQIILHYKITI